MLQTEIRFNGINTFISIAKKAIVFLFLNDSPFRTHLWFLNALLYCYIIVYMYKKYIKKEFYNVAFLIGAIFLISCYIIISIIFMQTHTNKIYLIRNFIFIGLPFFYIGNYIRRTEISSKIKNKSLIVIMIISIIMLFIEAKLYISEMYIGNVIFAISVFIFSIKNPNIKLKILEIIGDKYSLYMYILHPMLKDIINILYENIQLNSNLMLFAKPIFLIINNSFYIC